WTRPSKPFKNIWHGSLSLSTRLPPQSLLQQQMMPPNQKFWTSSKSCGHKSQMWHTSFQMKDRSATSALVPLKPNLKMALPHLSQRNNSQSETRNLTWLRRQWGPNPRKTPNNAARAVVSMAGLGAAVSVGNPKHSTNHNSSSSTRNNSNTNSHPNTGSLSLHR
ncbi:hypothetical protein BGZ80_009125, partial [Entomortierella chlamydospora]